jgi:hypothetical protein
LPGFSKQPNRAVEVGYSDIERGHPTQLFGKVRGSQVKATIRPHECPFEIFGRQPLGNE